ncbi:MAG: hypothetical protein HC853_14445 [Anaerolineae bacterium]|nr:hypothetical protein [Anaerolineae bacterium]
MMLNRTRVVPRWHITLGIMPENTPSDFRVEEPDQTSMEERRPEKMPEAVTV